MAVAVAVLAQQVNTLDALHQAYEKEEHAILVQYGTALNTIISDLKKKGDLDNFLVVQAEQKRFAAENTGPSPSKVANSFSPAFQLYARSMVALLGRYVTTLDELLKKEMVADRIEEAKLVKAEKDKISTLLKDLQSKLPATTAVERPKMNPVVSPFFKPKTYVDETKGWAGMEPHNNVYSFQVDNVGRSATFRFWASGDIGTTTSGQVVLTDSDGKEQVIRQWNPSDFKVAVNAVNSYTKLKPISCDVSSYVKQPGKYQFTFRWGGSQVGLSILRVELELR